MAFAALLGLTLGVAALVVSLALLSGFQTHIRARLVEETPHVLVSPAGRAPFTAEERLDARLGTIPGVKETEPVARGRVWLSLRGQVDTAEAVGRANVEGLELDIGQARRLGAFPGDVVLLVSSRSRLSPLGPIPIVGSVALTKLLPAGTGRRAPEAVVPLTQARRLFALGEGGASAYELKLVNPYEAARVAEEVRTRLGADIATTTWEDANRSLVLALKLERIVLFASVFLIVIVAGLNLAATSAVLAATRSGDAAVLSVLGAPPKEIRDVFLVAGAGVGIVGTLFGLVLGSLAAVVLDRTGAIPLPAQLYAMSHFPFRLEALDVAAVGVLSVVWSVLAASLPARTASRQDVAEVLRAA